MSPFRNKLHLLFIKIVAHSLKNFCPGLTSETQNTHPLLHLYIIILCYIKFLGGQKTWLDCLPTFCDGCGLRTEWRTIHIRYSQQ